MKSRYTLITRLFSYLGNELPAPRQPCLASIQRLARRGLAQETFVSFREPSREDGSAL